MFTPFQLNSSLIRVQAAVQRTLLSAEGCRCLLDVVSIAVNTVPSRCSPYILRFLQFSAIVQLYRIDVKVHVKKRSLEI